MATSTTELINYFCSLTALNLRLKCASLRSAQQVRIAGFGNSNSNSNDVELRAQIKAGSRSSSGKLSLYEAAHLDFGDILEPLFIMWSKKLSNENLSLYKSQDLSNLLWSYGLFGILHKDVFRKVSERALWKTRIRATINPFAPSSLGAVRERGAKAHEARERRGEAGRTENDRTEQIERKLLLLPGNHEHTLVVQHAEFSE